MIRVLILASNLVLRIGLREMLRGIQGVVVTGEVSSPAELDNMEAEADVVLLASASVDWFSADGGLAGDQTVLLLTDDPELGRALINRAGLWGIMPPDPGVEELAAGLQALHQGLVVLPPRLADAFLREVGREDKVSLDALAEPLTPRESETLGLLAQGLANKQIAVQLGISEHTVKFHISSVYAKLGATSRTDAVRLGTLRGLIVI